METLETSLVRVFKGPTYTIGRFSIMGIFFCDILEDTVRDKNGDGDIDDPGEEKVWGETAIPAGRYEVILAPSSHFKKLMPYLVGVKNFSGIMMHPGNDAGDTHGCLLMGVNSAKGKVLKSQITFDAWMVKFTKALKEGKKVFITIK